MGLRNRPLTLRGMILRDLIRRPMRTALAALGVAVGVVAIVALATIVRGLWDEVDAGLHLDEGDLVVFRADTAADILSVLDEAETRARLTALPDVSAVTATLWHVLPLEGHAFCLMLGMRLDEQDARATRLIDGRSPRADDEVVLGSIARKMLGKDVGDTLRIRDETYHVVGIFHVNVVFFDGAVVMSLPRLQHLAGREGRVTAFQVQLRPGADVTALAEQIEHTYPELVAISGASEYSKVDAGLEVARGMVWAVSFVAVVIGAIIIANTMWMTVLERTREIGVLRAVGWSRRRIVGMVVGEAAGVGLLAWLVGSVLGAGLARLAMSLPVAQQFVRPTFSPGTFVRAAVVAVVLSVIGALIPAWRAARISPAEALRYE